MKKPFLPFPENNGNNGSRIEVRPIATLFGDHCSKSTMVRNGVMVFYCAYTLGRGYPRFARRGQEARS